MMRILFVDDEPNVLNGLRRILRPMRNEWQMEFRESALDALESLGEGGCDVIVSDMKMPGMDGAEFLTAIRKDHPESIRIALSGETSAHMIYRCVENAHQYLAKPCEIQTLTDTVNRACSLRELVQHEDLKRIIAKINSLPSLPEAYAEIMRELQSENPSLERIGEIIESDVAMSAKLLQIVNSAFFGLVRHMSSPAEAATYLGVDVIKSLVLTTGVFSQFDESKVPVAALTALWNHSMRVGNLARRIVTDVTGDKLLADYAMMGGLLANAGELVIATNFPDQFNSIAAKCNSGDIDKSDVEREMLGHDHSEIGAYLLSIWGLPNPVVECVAYHHAPGRCVGQGFLPLTAVHIATAIVDAGDHDDLPGLDPDYVDKLGLEERVPGWAKAARDAGDAGRESRNG
ncbi:MAG: response regulator [Woeseiaceae bacterium]|nr:response regulator [Woeseiaceae bacterium]